MKNNSIMTLLFMLAFILAAVFYFNSKLNAPTKSDNVDEIYNVTDGTNDGPDNSIVYTEPVTEEAPSVMISFLDNFIASATSGDDGKTLNIAITFLSEGAKAGLGKEPTLEDLTSFIGVQKIPDQGYGITNVSYMRNTATGEEEGMAEIKVTLKYSTGDVDRVFTMSKAGYSWMIDKVE